MCVKWQMVFSEAFGIGNGVRQGGILSPFLFRFYIRKLIAEVVKLRIGCNIGGIFLNLFAYADDMVLIAPSWFALQKLLVTIQDEATSINMSFNTKKTVCMVFNPVQKCKVVAATFP